MAPLRVCALTYDWYPFDITVRRLSEAAVDGGCEASVVVLRQPHEPAYEALDGVQVYRAPLNRAYGQPLVKSVLGWLAFLFLGGWTLTRLHLKQRFDVIHVHNMPDFLVFAALIPRLMGAKVILEVQDVSPELLTVKAGPTARRVLWPIAVAQERLSTWFANHVVSVGWPFEQLLAKRGVPVEKMTTILNSADPKLFPADRRCRIQREAPSAERPFVLTYHGTVADRNGVDVALRAVALARQDAPYLEMRIMGRGERLPMLKQLAADLGIADAVTFVDPCPSERIVDFVAQSDAGIIPYRLDGFADLVLPTKAYEYAWLGCPIIASATPAIRSMYRPEAMALCAPEQPESFAEALVDLYRHPEKRLAMTQAAAADYERFRWEHMRVRYVELLTRLAGASSLLPDRVLAKA